MYAQGLSNDTLGFKWDGSTHSTHITANFCDWSVSNQEQISLIETFHQYLNQFLPSPNESLSMDTPHKHNVNEYLTFHT